MSCRVLGRDGSPGRIGRRRDLVIEPDISHIGFGAQHQFGHHGNAVAVYLLARLRDLDGGLHAGKAVKRRGRGHNARIGLFRATAVEGAQAEFVIADARHGGSVRQLAGAQRDLRGSVAYAAAGVVVKIVARYAFVRRRLPGQRYAVAGQRLRREVARRQRHGIAG